MSRTRNYATIVYPESAPDGWQSKLEEQAVKAFISPLHDKDKTENGEKKKEHYHVILSFDSVKTDKQAQNVVSCFGGVGCIAVNSLRSQVRYLTHIDSPDKAQYQKEDIVCLSGADAVPFFADKANDDKIIGDIEDFIIETQCKSFALLAVYARKVKPEWVDVIRSKNCFYIKEFIQSYAYSVKNKEQGYNYLMDKQGNIIEL